MANDVEIELISQLKNVKFALQLDETTLPDNSAILIAYVRYLHENTIKEEMLFIRNLKTDKRGESIFTEVHKYFTEHDLPFENIIACATYGAASMTVRYRGFIAYLKSRPQNLFCIHCVIHRQHLVSKELSVKWNSSLSIVIKAIKHIKSNSLQDRIFRELCIIIMKNM
ncbi:SCAN domain-containing protein 3 [Dictyocoela muelleri]|nr:SCAN domain-containing protein 3 [Dictyocoela muelleri]